MSIKKKEKEEDRMNECGGGGEANGWKEDLADAVNRSRSSSSSSSSRPLALTLRRTPTQKFLPLGE